MERSPVNTPVRHHVPLTDRHVLVEHRTNMLTAFGLVAVPPSSPELTRERPTDHLDARP